MSYVILSKLGKGAFGTVYRFRHSNNNEYALKIIKLEDVSFADVMREGETMMNLSHPHVVQCCHCSKLDVVTACLLMEFCGRGTLSQEIESSIIEETRAIRWFAQIADAIKYLHGRHVMHRDIKPDNILITSSDNIKVGDLGLAKELGFTAQSAGTSVGTPCYMSPQILNGERYNNKTDVWSLGCVFHQVLSRGSPFHFTNVSAIFNGPTPALPASTSNRLRVFIFTILERNESNRPTAQEIFDFIKGSFLFGRYEVVPHKALGKVTLDKIEIKRAMESYSVVSLANKDEESSSICGN